MSYVQYVYHFVGMDSIDVRLVNSGKHKKLLEDCVSMFNSTSNDYLQISSDRFKQDIETIGRMFNTHFPEYLV
jgi:hypothetical protein